MSIGPSPATRLASRGDSAAVGEGDSGLLPLGDGGGDGGGEPGGSCTGVLSDTTGIGDARVGDAFALQRAEACS